jgi:glycosyltransferase involved in cell wall biosynthesis
MGSWLSDGLDFRMNERPLVSVIVPTRNSELTIDKCIESIVSQTYEPIQIIVVDNFSTDSTREIAQRLGAVVVQSRGERSKARNLGAKMARGSYLYFVDADCKLDPQAISDCVDAINHADGVLTDNQDVNRRFLVSRLVASRRFILSKDPLNIAIRFVRKRAFETVGGFDEDLYVGEDLDFQRRFLMKRLRLAPAPYRAKEWHLGSPVDMKGLLYRSLYYAPNYLKYSSKNPLASFRRANPIRDIATWKRSCAPCSDILPALLIGLLSNIFLIVGFFLNTERKMDGDFTR